MALEANRENIEKAAFYSEEIIKFYKRKAAWSEVEPIIMKIYSISQKDREIILANKANTADAKSRAAD